MRRLLPLIMLLLVATPSWASLANVYIAQSVAGGNTGANCSNAHAVGFFNTAANWGAGAAQIGAGTTVHLCGTFTFTAGTSGLIVQGNGASGNPVIILFEGGAILQAPYFLGVQGGGVVVNGFSDITIDGGTNGLIQNTANGTNLANHQSSVGVYIRGATRVTVKNLTIDNIYINAGSSSSATDTAGQDTENVLVDNGANSASIVITNNTLRHSRTGVDARFASTNINGLTVSNNTLRDHGWHMSIAGITGTATDFNIFGNDFSDWSDWQYPINTYHTNGIITYTGRNGAAYSPNIYNNYFHGNLGTGSPTAFVYCTTADTSPTPISCNVFNNVFVGTGAPGVGLTSFWVGGGLSGTFNIYNNTFIGPNNSTQTSAIVEYSPGLIVKNNIFEQYGTAISSASTLSTHVTAADNNAYFNMVGTLWFSDNITAGTGPQYTFSQWKALGGKNFDAHGVTTDPKLDSTYHLQSGSSAIGLGVNLTSLGITALNSDKAGIARPGSGSWDAGVYLFVVSGGCSPSITGLTLNPTTVTSGSTSTGIITISCAPSVDTNVTISSNSSSAASAPTPCTVLGNQTSCSFTITTYTVPVQTVVTFTATLGGSVTAQLTVNPPPTGRTGQGGGSIVGGSSKVGL